MPKDNDKRDVNRNFEMGELRESGGRAVALVNFRVVVLGLETLWRPILKLLGPKLAKKTQVSSPSTACCLVLKLRCEAFMHTVSVQKMFAEKKKSVTPAKASRDQSHHTVCTEEIAATSTPFRKLAGAQKRPSRFRWNLVPRLIDACRIRISNPLENSSTKKGQKNCSLILWNS